MQRPSEADQVRKWMGGCPEACDICNRPIAAEKFFVDGKTKMGPWGIMCPHCFASHGYGLLGTGIGQKYDAKTLIKLEG
jgi:hypothetical protein